MHFLLLLALASVPCLSLAQEQNATSSFPFKPKLAVQQLQGRSETCSVPEAQSVIEEVVQQYLQEDILDELSCDNSILGIFEYCPAANCSEIFSASQTVRFPGYYWITAENGSIIQVHCDFELAQFPYSVAEIENTADDSCPTNEQREFVQKSSDENIRNQLSKLSPSLIACTPQVYGLVAHCPTNSCSQIFDLVQEGFLHLSNHYWLITSAGGAVKVYCNRSTMLPEYSSCQQLFLFEILPSGTYTFRTPAGTHVDVYCNNQTRQGEFESCAHANLFDLPCGTYTIQSSDGTPVTVYCDMDNAECGGGAWVRVASYNYSDPNTNCPSTWNQTTSPIRACDRVTSEVGSCSSATFPTSGIQFNSVCGRVIAVQYGSPEAFDTYHRVSGQRAIDNHYVDGVSITYNSNPRQHIWTFAAYPSDDYTDLTIICPCSQPALHVPSPPIYVGNNYFCDTASETFGREQYYTEDPLWDGQGCSGPGTCCSFNNPPWFSTTLPLPITEDIEVRICDGAGSMYDRTPIVSFDLYIQ